MDAPNASTPEIDLSAGLVPAPQAQPAAQPAQSQGQSPAQPMPGQDSIDLSAGMVDEPKLPEVGTISALPAPSNAFDYLHRWATNVQNDIKYGTDQTGIGTLLKKMGAHGVYMGNPEAVGDFMASLPLGLLKAGGGAANMRNHPWQGTKEVVGGTLQAADMPGAFIAPEAAEASEVIPEAVAATGSKAVKGVAKVYNAIKDAFDTGVIQKPLQEGIRGVMSKVAEENGIEQPLENISIRDVVKDVADKMQVKAKGLYQELDTATGGRLQRFDEALKNINQKLRDVAGLDDEQEAALLEKKANTEVARAEALKNVEPQKIQNATESYKRSMALQDLNDKLDMKSVVKGQHPSENVAAINPTPSGETINPEVLHGNLKALEKTGRLQEAVGQQHAMELTSHADFANQTRKQILLKQRIAKVAGTALGTAAGIGGGLAIARATHVFVPGQGVLPVE